MPERDRPSLTGLSIKRPLPERGKPVVPIDAAESALFGGEAAAPEESTQKVHTSGQSEGLSTIHSPVLSPSLLKAKKKEIKIAWTFKIPYALHEELAAVASHNGLTMSEIVIEAIQFHLPNFPHAPAK